MVDIMGFIKGKMAVETSGKNRGIDGEWVHR